ncbi:SDR family oxidoreductase [Virgibacillus halodenitrificans]|jgi:NADP-dependent 3-hydroxy acid dehydrogenase YdfG|uniref:SDR family oxidoreductase n=1 Tax=Virgibacillus halodenitrificans TaxID=1482 RepID=A0ABR7VQY4_VIRHA|nr:SDR family oxidoreductase [Virgibacillus halodenitrificans]MBD1224319.1 SDR family oxidoreductase [Virgibacillus halodenitrificans]MEC2158473.1 SDR family oxidoreductase [Virgibacillus halodenitrificans]MYL57830.1 SDR family NAD(P)-dependent oxidoreductase [Virgibacillus halodenitrificans]WHX26961.1 SDR family oxidoreductase [Virgibacillus halodenitrificans]
MDLIGKTAIITGASSGIGKGIAKHLSDVGVNVVLAARNKEKLAGVAEEINQSMQGKALAVETDVSNKEDMDVLIKQARNTFGKVDIFVNNAGQMLHSRVQDGHVDEWEKMIDVNIKGVLYGIHGVLPEMLERKSGHIINIASVSGHEVTKVSTVYSATKFAVRAISMGLEKELARTGVRVTNISPGKVDTDLASASQSSDRKPLHTDDIAKSVIYAVSQPDYVNVNEITVRPV